MYKPENEPTRNLNAILSLIVFARLYARSLKQRLTEVEAASEQYTQRNLERLTTYTTYLIGNLLRDGLQLSWVSIYIVKLTQILFKYRITKSNKIRK